MGLFSRRKKTSRSMPTGWIPATAVIVTSSRDGDSPNQGVTTTFDVVVETVVDRARGIGYDLVLDVRPPGGEPYKVSTRVRAPVEAERTGLLQTQVLSPGLELPIVIDPADPMSVEVAWEQFLASSGRVEALNAARGTRQDELMAQQMARNPTQQRKLQDQYGPVAMQHAHAVNAGHLTLAEWERDKGILLRRGQLRQEDYDAARAVIEDAPQPGAQ